RLRVKRDKLDLPIAIRSRMLSRDPRAKGSNFRPRLRRGHLWLEASDRGNEARKPRGRRLKEKVGESRRSPEGDVPGESEVARHDAHHGAALLAKLDLATDDLRIAPETLLPKAVAQDHDTGRAIFVVRVAKAPA